MPSLVFSLTRRLPITCLLVFVTACALNSPTPPGPATLTPEPPPSASTPALAVETAVLPPTAEPTSSPDLSSQSVPPTTTPASTPIQAGPEFTRVKIFLIAVGDNGVSGPKIGCGDSVVGVEREIPPTRAPLAAALKELLSLHDRNYGQSGLYNSLYQANLALESVTINDGTAVIKMTGTLNLGGECDDPRVDSQITQTALQFSTVYAVDAYINGAPLKGILSGKGP